MFFNSSFSSHNSLNLFSTTCKSRISCFKCSFSFIKLLILSSFWAIFCFMTLIILALCKAPFLCSLFSFFNLLNSWFKALYFFSKDDKASNWPAASEKFIFKLLYPSLSFSNSLDKASPSSSFSISNLFKLFISLSFVSLPLLSLR